MAKGTNNNYAIDTAEIYSGLSVKCATGELELSKNDFFNIQHAIERVLHTKKVQSNNTLQGIDLRDYIFDRYEREISRAKESTSFPIPNYILFHKNMGAMPSLDKLELQRKEPDLDAIAKEYRFIFLEDDKCIVSRTNQYFSLLFATQLAITDPLNVNAFLNFHFLKSFKKDKAKYKIFLDAIQIEYKRFGISRLTPIIENYFTNLNSEPIKESLIVTPIVNEGENNINIKDITTKRQVIAMKYLLEEIGVEAIDKTVIVDFIKMITGKELNQKNKDGNIYKYLRQPLSKNDKAVTNDLKFVRNYFENLGLMEITNKINKEIASRE